MSDKVEFSVDVKMMIDALTQLNVAAQVGLEKGVLAGGLVIQAGMKRRITQGGKTGLMYKRGKSGWHQASAPGEAPASDMGALANSIETRLTHSDDDSAESETGPTVEYGEKLEFGTPGGKIKARPYGRPTIDEDAKTIQAAMEAAVMAEIKKAMGI